MRYSALLTAAFAIGALAGPVIKRDDVYETVVVTDVVTVTAYADQAAPTTQAGRGKWRSWRYRPQPVTTTEAPPPPPPAPTTEAPPPPPPAPTTEAAPEPVTTEAAPAPPPPAPETPAPAPPPAAPTKSYGGDYAGVALKHHNVHRANHSVSDLVWDDGLAATAAKIAASCNYAHNVEMDGGGYGQNIAAGVPANNVSAVITDLFYNGEMWQYAGEYGKADCDPNLFHAVGHFTQIVWKTTTSVGCATQDCSARGLGGVGGSVSPHFTVCNYKGPGNWAGQYGNNVLPPLGHPTVWSDY